MQPDLNPYEDDPEGPGMCFFWLVGAWLVLACVAVCYALDALRG